MTVTRSKKTAKREKWNRAVSKKFYDFVLFQIRCAQCVSEDEEVRVDVMMERFDEYIEKGTVKVDFNNTETVVFAMLQPHVDKAVARTKRAREAAARRRAARQAAETDQSETESMTATQDKTEKPKVEDTTVGTCHGMSPDANHVADNHVSGKKTINDIKDAPIDVGTCHGMSPDTTT